MLCYTIETIITLSIVCVIFPQTETTLAKCGYSRFDLKISYLGFGRKSLENFTLTDCRPDQCVSPFCQGVLDTQPNPHITDFCEWEQFILVCFFPPWNHKKTVCWPHIGIHTALALLKSHLWLLLWVEKHPPIQVSKSQTKLVSMTGSCTRVCMHQAGSSIHHPKLETEKFFLSPF